MNAIDKAIHKSQSEINNRNFRFLRGLKLNAIPYKIEEYFPPAVIVDRKYYSNELFFFAQELNIYTEQQDDIIVFYLDYLKTTWN